MEGLKEFGGRKKLDILSDREMEMGSALRS